MVIACVVLFASGCENHLSSLLGVERPGQLSENALNEARMVPSWFAGVQSDFECAFPLYVVFFGYWSGELNNGVARNRQVEMRSFQEASYDRACEAGTYANPGFAALQMARAEAQKFANRVSSFPDEIVADKHYKLGRARLYEGYATLLLTEGFCAFVMDGGPLMTRAEGFGLAADRFTKALAHAVQVPEPDRAAEIRNAALIGRARARLNLWSMNRIAGVEVVSDAQQVEDRFVFYATFDVGQGDRRVNRMVNQPNSDVFYIAPKIRPLRALDGVPDPRVPVFEGKSYPDGVNVLGWEQARFVSEGDDLPVGTWREAKLMIAEVVGGQTAVDIINDLRANVTSAPYVKPGAYDLPVFASTDPAEIRAEVREERLRETFLMGTHMGDLMRWRGDPVRPPLDVFPTGVPERGGQYNDEATCRPLPDYEVLGNPNINATPPFPTTPL